MRISQTKTDEGLEKDGVLVDIRYGVRVLVARAGNPRAEAWRAKLSWEDRRLLDNADLQKGRHERVVELMVAAIAETMLLGWEGLEDDDDKPIAFSIEKAKELLKEYDWFRQDVLEAATTRETYFASEVRELGNVSPKSSAGKRSTQAA
jgi:hypothetical protein